MKLRTNTFKFTNMLVYAKEVPKFYYNRCICCRQEILEDHVHLLLNCPTFKSEREKYIKLKIYCYNVPGPPGKDYYVNLVKKILGEIV